eukprot:TRINITY_DN1147_c0_g1_i2.p1 TRINITY_DN1147_c0_g1~~TRINITY_DN1147_c0_g1_i2.p1  ORF type:complete len:561 (-),score=186.46 TRINITY_DN1147_c0_g1_i2:388-2070(-)
MSSQGIPKPQRPTRGKAGFSGSSPLGFRGLSPRDKVDNAEGEKEKNRFLKPNPFGKRSGSGSGGGNSSPSGRSNSTFALKPVSSAPEAVIRNLATQAGITAERKGVRRAGATAPPPSSDPTPSSSFSNVAMKKSLTPPTIDMFLNESASIERRLNRPVEENKQVDVDKIIQDASKFSEERELLMDERDYLLEKLRLTEEEICAEQAHTLELEKQLRSLGDGIPLESRIQSRKENLIKQRDATVKVMIEEGKGSKDDDVLPLRVEAQLEAELAASVRVMALETWEELEEMKSTTNRLLLTSDEKEEVVMKRCWLGRYWQLAERYGVHKDVAKLQNERWHKLAPCPLEVVLDIGQRAMEEADDGTGNFSSSAGLGNSLMLSVTSEDTIESMLLVDEGLRCMAELQVEMAVQVVMAQHRSPPLMRPNASGDGVIEAPSLETVELSEDEVEDVQFKQHWLVYFWRRAKNKGVEADIANERLRFWIMRARIQQPTPQDIVDVERGLEELRKLGMDHQLWDVLRSNSDPLSSSSISLVRRSMSLALEPSSFCSSSSSLIYSPSHQG